MTSFGVPLRKPALGKWTSRTKSAVSWEGKPDGELGSRDSAAQILVSSGELDLEEANQIVDYLVTRYLRRKDLARTAPGFALVRKKLASLQIDIQSLVNQIKLLDEVTIAVINGSQTMLLLESDDSEIERINKIVSNANPTELCNEFNSNSTEGITWVDRLTALQNYLFLVENMFDDKTYSDKGPNNGPYPNKIISPEFKLTCEGCWCYNSYFRDTSVNCENKLHEFLGEIRYYAVKGGKYSVDWMHPYVVIFNKITSSIEKYETEASLLRTELKMKQDDGKNWRLSVIEEALDRLEQIFEDDLAPDEY